MSRTLITDGCRDKERSRGRSGGKNADTCVREQQVDRTGIRIYRRASNLFFEISSEEVLRLALTCAGGKKNMTGAASLTPSLKVGRHLRD